MADQEFKVTTKKTKKKVAKKPAELKPPKTVKRVRTPRNDMLAVNKPMVFSAWYANQITLDKRLKEWHFQTMQAYIKGMGLTEFEPSDRYVAALKVYFGEG